MLVALHFGIKRQASAQDYQNASTMLKDHETGISTRLSKYEYDVKESQ